MAWHQCSERPTSETKTTRISMGECWITARLDIPTCIIYISSCYSTAYSTLGHQFKWYDTKNLTFEYYTCADTTQPQFCTLRAYNPIHNTVLCMKKPVFGYFQTFFCCEICSNWNRNWYEFKLIAGSYFQSSNVFTLTLSLKCISNALFLSQTK